MKKVKNKRLPQELEAKKSDMKHFFFEYRFNNLLYDYEFFRFECIRREIPIELIDKHIEGLYSLYDLYSSKKNEKN